MWLWSVVVDAVGFVGLGLSVLRVGFVHSTRGRPSRFSVVPRSCNKKAPPSSNTTHTKTYFTVLRLLRVINSRLFWCCCTPPTNQHINICLRQTQHITRIIPRRRRGGGVRSYRSRSLNAMAPPTGQLITTANSSSGSGQ